MIVKIINNRSVDGVKKYIIAILGILFIAILLTGLLTYPFTANNSIDNNIVMVIIIIVIIAVFV